MTLEDGTAASKGVLFSGNVSRDTQTGRANRYQRYGLFIQGASDQVYVVGNDFRFNCQNPGFSSTSTGTVRLGLNLTNDTANRSEYIDYPRTLGTMLWDGVAFAALGTPANGTFVYCTDCTTANPCAGTGAFAKRLNGIWACN